MGSSTGRTTSRAAAFGAGLVVGLIGPGSWAMEQRPGTYVPTDVNTVVATVERTYLAERERSNTTGTGEGAELERAIRVARYQLELARRHGDARYAGRAEATLARWWGAAHPPVELALLRAELQARRHAFDEANAGLVRLLRREPGHPRALLALALVLQASGDIDASATRCRELYRIRPGVAAATCLGLAESLSGRARQGYARIARRLARARHIDASTHVWSLTALAEIATRLGWTEQALMHLERAHRLAPGDDAVIGAIADQYFESGADRKILDLLTPFVDRDRQLLRLASAALRLADPRGEPLKARLEKRLAASRRRGEPQFSTEALFWLDIADAPQRAAHLALLAWGEERTADNTYLAVRAAHANGEEPPAPIVAWIRKTGLRDARIERIGE